MKIYYILIVELLINQQLNWWHLDVFVSFGERCIFSLNFDSDNYFGKKQIENILKKKPSPIHE